MAFALEKLMFKPPRRSLNVEELMKQRAMRITYAGDGKGGFDPDEAADSFAVVSDMNDKQPGGVTTSWPDKPSSYELASKMINGQQQGKPFLNDEKYHQIVGSAKNLGLSEEQIFLK